MQTLLLSFVAVVVQLFTVTSHAEEWFSRHVVRVGNGSGVVIGGQYVVTARHVLQDMGYPSERILAETVFDALPGSGVSPAVSERYNFAQLVFVPPASSYDVSAINSQSIKMRWGRKSYYLDFAMLKFDRSYSLPVHGLPTVDPSSLKPGDPLIAVGHLKGREQVDRGLVFKSFDGKSIVFEYSRDSSTGFQPGYSGGALLTPDGRLLGINYIQNQDLGQGAATSILYIKDYHPSIINCVSALN